MTERTATCNWFGDLASGSGLVEGVSGALGELPVTWASRTSRAEGRTSPEELIAAAHAACFSMALSHGLAEGGTPAEELHVSATVTLDQVDGVPTVTTSDLVVTGTVPGIDAIKFLQAATDAAQNCPVSRALASLDVMVTATLEAV